MNFSDTWAEDEQGNKFVFTVVMKRRLHKAGLPLEPENLKELAEEPAPSPRPQHSQPAEKPKTQAVNEPESIQIEPISGKYLGTLKWYNPSRGYGFISRGGGEDIFFHKTSAISDPVDLGEGQWVLYDVEERNKGPEATEVEPYSGELLEE
jgi:CspA family cold shock protein